MRPHIPPPILMVLAAALMWALDHWMSVAQWIARPWNQLGGLVAAIGVAIAVAAFARFHQVGTTVNPTHPTRLRTSSQTASFASVGIRCIWDLRCC